MAEYVKEFHPRMVGLTGTPEQVRPFALRCLPACVEGVEALGRRAHVVAPCHSLDARCSMDGSHDLHLHACTYTRANSRPPAPLPRGRNTWSQARAAARAYRVYYSRTNDSPDDYLVDHSIITYLVAPDGSFVTFYGKNFEAPEMGASMAGHVAGWAEAHPEYRARLISAHADKKRAGEASKAGGKPEAGAKEA